MKIGIPSASHRSLYKEDMIQVQNHKQLGVTRSSVFEQEHEGGGFGETRTQAPLCYNRDSRLYPVGNGSPLKGLISFKHSSYFQLNKLGEGNNSQIKEKYKCPINMKAYHSHL